MKTVYDEYNGIAGIGINKKTFKNLRASGQGNLMETVFEEKSAIIECQKGNLYAFSSIYDIYFQKIYNFVFYRTYDKNLSEDITSITFTKALENIRRYESGKGNFSSWLYRIAQNTLIDYWRTEKKSISIEEKEIDVENDYSLENSIDAKENLKKIEEYLKTLPEEHREIVKMRVWDDLSYKEIAEILGKSESSCKVAFSRIISKMQKEVPYLLALMVVVNIIRN